MTATINRLDCVSTETLIVVYRELKLSQLKRTLNPSSYIDFLEYSRELEKRGIKV